VLNSNHYRAPEIEVIHFLEMYGSVSLFRSNNRE